MRKIFILTKREFLTAVRTKSFLIGLIIAPVLMGGSFFVINIFKDKVDINDKKIAVIDHSGVVAEPLKEIVKNRNENEIFDSETGEKNRPAFRLEIYDPKSDDLDELRLNLSQRIRNKELHAFVEIGPEVLNPGSDVENDRIKYYAENAMIDDIRDWVSGAINNHLRKLRVEKLNIDSDVSNGLFYWIHVEGMGLVSFDKATGDVKDAKKSNIADALAVPYILMMIMFMMVMMFTVPLLSAVMEEKTERIAEVLLGSVTPFQFLMGKLLGSLCISLIGSAVYLIGGSYVATTMGYADSVPYHLFPWFIAFLILNIFMMGSIMAALGSASNNSKDAQSLQFPAMIPVLIPMFVMFPLLKDPLSNFSTVLSLIPPFTPMLMIVRQATPVSIPMWQPIIGIVGVLLFTLFTIWLGSRMFRACILMQGSPPKFSNLIRWAVKG